MEAPPLISDKRLNANEGAISWTENLPKIISFRNLALLVAAPVVPGVTLKIKSLRLVSLSECLKSFICSIISDRRSLSEIGFGIQTQ